MSTMQIDRLLDTVVKTGASDLHLTVGRPPTIRLHGHLRNLQTKVLDSDDMVGLMKSITPERNQQELQERGGTDFGFAYGEAARFRVSVFRQRGDLAMVLRQIPNKLLSLEVIGLPEVVRDLIRRPRGMFLVTGPTGSGKTTTLYSVLNHINSEGINIMTLEDPVEYPMALVRQTSVSESAKLDFANGIRSMMRQDPDIILVGEARDKETAQIAIQASLTGHLVFTTLHTNDAPTAVSRLIDMGIDLLNPIQWRCKGMERCELKRDFGDKLVFHGAMDNQQTLPFGTVEDVRREVAENIEILGKGGGYILAPCHNIQVVSPAENIVAMYEAALAYQ